MHVVVCLAAIVDPKVPPHRLTLSPAGAELRAPGVDRVLGPFDQAALEIALRLRDAHPDTRTTAIMLGGIEDETCLRHALALRVDRGLRVDVEAHTLWDHGAVCRALRQAIVTLEPAPDLILLGREVGDRDDGVVPPLLAESLGWRFFGLCHRALLEAGAIVGVRERGAAEERAAFPPPVVVSVTNHPDARLRLPLLKNVLAARRQAVPARNPEPATDERRVRVVGAELAPPPSRGGQRCRLVAGSPEAQAAELARFLAPWVRQA